jgi:putative ABC transport system permease protein
MPKRILSLFRNLFRKGAVEQELDDELRSSVEVLTQEKVKQGLSQSLARREALIELGGVEQVKEEVRGVRAGRILEDFAKDIRFAVRMLAKSPGFTAVAVLTLALGIGANTAIFSIINAVFLRPLPFPHANRIYVVDRVNNAYGGSTVSLAIYTAWQRQRALFDHLALVTWQPDVTLTGGETPVLIPATGASAEYFSLLGVHPLLGRAFLPEECRPGGPDVVMLSYGLWRSRFGADKHIVGRAIPINSRPYTVVGVLPGSFEPPIMSETKLWFPAHIPMISNDPTNGGRICLGLLRRGVTPAQAASALTPPLARLRREFPKMFNRNERAHLQPLRSFLSSGAGTGPWLLFAAVGLVLLLVCANVANLALARATARQREIAIRTAIGAHRGRIVRQLLTESVTLALTGGALAVLLCYISFGFIRSLVPEGLMHVGSYRIDGTVLIFSVLLTLCAAIVFGFAPALVSTRVDLSVAFNKGSAEAGPAGPKRLQSVLAASEVAVSLVVLIGALLSLESLARLMGVRLGFDPRQVLTFTVSLPQEKYNTLAKKVEFYQEATDRLQNIPGVQQSAVINYLPFGGGGDILFGILGSAKAQPPGTPLAADYRVVSPGFFRTLRIPLLGGRRLARTDDSTNAPVVVINRAMAKMYWGSQDPIGQDILVGKGMGPQFTEPRPREIVGIVGDICDESLAEPPAPTMYIPNAQAVLGASEADSERSFVVRDASNPGSRNSGGSCRHRIAGRFLAGRPA